MADEIDLSGKDILIVEDDEMNFIYLKQLFSIIGGNITHVNSGKDALELASKRKFGIIFMDILLPDYNGKEITHKLRQCGLRSLIIAQTASHAPEDHEEILQSGCDDILSKPFSLEKLKKCLLRNNVK